MYQYAALVEAAAGSVRTQGFIWLTEPHPPATADAIARCEKAIGIELPPSYKEVLREHDGVTFVIKLAPGVEMFLMLLGTREIVDETLRMRGGWVDFPQVSLDGLVVFADSMDGDVCLFDQMQARDGRVPVLGGGHEDDPGLWRETVIADDFGQWLRNVLAFVTEYGNHNDFRYWWVPDCTRRR
jgi:SMI1 / KNR4 family (SUKH-1)